MELFNDKKRPLWLGGLSSLTKDFFNKRIKSEVIGDENKMSFLGGLWSRAHIPTLGTAGISLR